jgi:hypothetical protein
MLRFNRSKAAFFWAISAAAVGTLNTRSVIGLASGVITIEVVLTMGLALPL